VLLAEAGWKDRDGDGLVEDREGKPFTLTIRTNQGNDERKKIAELMQQRLKDVGIQADIQLIEWAAFIKEFVKPRRFEVVVLGLGSGTDPDQFVVWHSSQRGPDQMNRTGYANPEVDRLLELGRGSCVQKDRVRYYHRIQQILAEDLPMIFLYTADALPVVAARVRGVSPAAAGILHNLTEWYVPKQQQRYTSG
jgi:peptide/nickel transport system substrate-binding protein